MKHKKTKMMGLMSAAALALGVQQAGAADIVVSNDVTASTTWLSSNVYKLDRLILVKNGATLTIQPGTVIRGLPVGPVPSEPGSLLICRGAKINAQGTAANPIVFTDQYDDSIGANPGSTNNPVGTDYGKLNNQLTGQWGGVIVAGRSYIAWDSLDSSGVYSPDGRVESAIEGLVHLTGDCSYGGQDDMDNSGIMNYVSSRYGGFVLGPTKEINGFTFCGVGRGTTLDHLDVYNTKDDNVEFFGGTVGLKHLVAWNGTDDGIDTDTGWRGKIQFALVVAGVSTVTGGAGQAPDSADKGLEWDGAGDGTGFNDDPQSCGSLFNFTFVGAGKNSGDPANTFANIRDNGAGRIYNGIVMDFAGGITLIEGDTNTWALGSNCSAMKLYQDYAQDGYFLGNTNRQGLAVNNPGFATYIGYPDAIPGSKKLEFKHNLFWNFGTPHSIGMTNGYPTAAGKELVGTDNSRFSTHAHFGFSPNNTGYDVASVNGNLVFDNTSLPAPSGTPIAYYERDTTVYNFQPTFRPVAHPYTCVKKIDPRANTNFWSAIATYGVQPPADGFYTPVQFIGAMGQKNWAGPWSTPWRLGGFVTNNVATGDETGIVPTITTGAGVVNIALNSDTYVGINADFWLVAVKSTGAIYRFNLATGNWVAGLASTLQGPLLNASPAIPISTASLSAGSYDIYFGVDLVKDNLVTFDQLYVAGAHIVK